MFKSDTSLPPHTTISCVGLGNMHITMYLHVNAWTSTIDIYHTYGVMTLYLIITYEIKPGLYLRVKYFWVSAAIMRTIPSVLRKIHTAPRKGDASTRYATTMYPAAQYAASTVTHTNVEAMVSGTRQPLSGMVQSFKSHTKPYVP
jgi:hypothetical protein